MLSLYVRLKSLMNDEEGQGLVEYALIIVLISLGCIVAMKGLATGIGATFTTIVAKLAAP